MAQVLDNSFLIVNSLYLFGEQAFWLKVLFASMQSMKAAQ